MQFIILSHVSCYSFTLFSPRNPALHEHSTLYFLTALHNISTRPKFHIMWVPKSPLYGPQKYIVFLIPFSRGWFELRKTPIVCRSVWFHLISFFSKNNDFRAKMCGTLKIDLFIRYNFCEKYFFPRSIFIDIKWINLLKTFFKRK